MGGFSVNSGGQCRFLPDDQNIKKRNLTGSFYFRSELDAGPSPIEVAEEIL
jgi:hypothetical protein